VLKSGDTFYWIGQAASHSKNQPRDMPRIFNNNWRCPTIYVHFEKPARLGAMQEPAKLDPMALAAQTCEAERLLVGQYFSPSLLFGHELILASRSSDK
jgi:hypothetical protein